MIGALIGLLAYSASGGRRDLSSVSGMSAGRYDVVASEAVSARARQVLSETRPEVATARQR